MVHLGSAIANILHGHDRQAETKLTERVVHKTSSLDIGICDEEALRQAIESYFGVQCSKLVKVARGSFHQVWLTFVEG